MTSVKQMSAALTFIDATAAAQTKLRQTIDPACTVKVHKSLNEDLIETILRVDAYKFRQELRYRREEVIEHSGNPGFILITAETNGQPLGIVYGYDEPDGGFFLDTLASMVEGKGIGHTLATLIIIHAKNIAHSHVTLYTEEEDEQERKLRQFYLKMGFVYLGTEVEKGDVMVLQLNNSVSERLYNRYIAGEYAQPLVPVPIPA